MGVEHVGEVKSMEVYLMKYDNYIKAKKIGVVFSPRDITMEEVNAFYIIESAIEANNG